MTKQTASLDLSMMTLMPLQQAWLSQLPAYQSSDARVVRGAMNLLFAAFHNIPAGTLNYQTKEPEVLISGYAQIPVELAREHLAVLLAGWKITRGRITFEPLHNLARSLHEDYPHALEKLQRSAALAIAAPDLFNSELMPAQGGLLASQVGDGTRKKAQEIMSNGRIKKELPEGATMTLEMQEMMRKRGFSADAQEAVWERFVDYCRSFQFTAASWGSRFRIWLDNQVNNGQLVADIEEVSASAKLNFSPKTRSSLSFRPARNVSRAEQAASASKSELDRVELALSRATATHQRPAQ